MEDGCIDKNSPDVAVDMVKW